MLMPAVVREQILVENIELAIGTSGGMIATDPL
jgi:hypothetical protein